jgi:hypothetical protein
MSQAAVVRSAAMGLTYVEGKLRSRAAAVA